MTLFRRLAMALALSLLPCIAAAQSPSKLDAILTRGTLRVGLTGDYRPFSLRDKDTGAFTGLDVDMAQSLAKGLGVKLELVQTAWGALLPDLSADKFDLAMGGISVTLDRQKAAYFSIPVMRTGKTPIARCADAAKFATLADIDKPGVKVITNPGGTNERFDRAALKQADIVVFADNAKIFDELVAGHADLMLTDAVETRLQQKLHPELCAIHPDAPFDFSELAYLLPRDATLKDFVDQWLHLSVETGEYGRLTDKWLK
jgi:cyclohexadienyl dehydratase